MTAHAWLAANLPDARPFPKSDSATSAWRTNALFIKFFPYALQERAAVETEIASAGLHENIIPSLLMSGVDDGVILIYPFASGETLGSAAARDKFYALPESERRAALHVICAALATITSAGWTLVDFYEGNLIYDYENKKIWLFDWDLCIKAESFTLATHRNWGSSRLMAPEEFQKGAQIDGQTNVFNLARLATLVLGDDATDAERAVLARATSPEKPRRHASVAAFVGEQHGTIGTMRRYTFLLPLAALSLLGCSPEKPAEPESPAPVAAAHTADDGHNHDGAAPPEAPRAPMAGAPTAGNPMADATDPFAPLSKTPELDKKIADAEKSGDKTALSAAYSKRGMFRMRDDDKAGQRVKYRGALADFRKALKTDPKNVEALAAKSEIESIYTGMGRPIPSEAEADEVSRTGTYKPQTGK